MNGWKMMTIQKKPLTPGTKVKSVDRPILKGIVFNEEGGIYDILWEGKYKTMPMYLEQIILVRRKMYNE